MSSITRRSNEPLSFSLRRWYRTPDGTQEIGKERFGKCASIKRRNPAAPALSSGASWR